MSLDSATCPKCGTEAFQFRVIELPEFADDRWAQDLRLFTVRWVCPHCGLLFETKVQLDEER